MTTQKKVLSGFFAALFLLEVATLITSNDVLMWIQVGFQLIFSALMILFIILELRKDTLKRDDEVLQLSIICGLWCVIDFLFTCQTYHVFTYWKY